MFVFFNLALGSCTILDKDHNHTKSKVGSLVVWSRKIKRAKNTTSNNKFDTFSNCPIGLNSSKTFCVTLHISYMLMTIQKFFLSVYQQSL